MKIGGASCKAYCAQLLIRPNRWRHIPTIKIFLVAIHIPDKDPTKRFN